MTRYAMNLDDRRGKNDVRIHDNHGVEGGQTGARIALAQRHEGDGIFAGNHSQHLDGMFGQMN